MANKILTFSDLEEFSNFPPKVDWSESNRMHVVLPTLNTRCCTIGDVKNNYLVTSTEDDNKLAIENDFQEKDVVEYNFSIGVSNGGHSGNSSPKNIAITGHFGDIIYDEGDSQVLEWNTIGQLRPSYIVNDNLVNFPKAYVVRDSGEINVSTTDLSIEVTYEDGSSATYSGREIRLTMFNNNIKLNVGNALIPDKPIVTGDTSTVTVILRYDFSGIVKDGTALYNLSFEPVYYNETGDIKVPSSVVNFRPPAQIGPGNMVVDYTLGSFSKGSSIYLWFSDKNHYCGTAFTSLQTSMTTKIKLNNELTTIPTQYTIPSHASEPYYIIIGIYEG